MDDKALFLILTLILGTIVYILLDNVPYGIDEKYKANEIKIKSEMRKANIISGVLLLMNIVAIVILLITKSNIVAHLMVLLVPSFMLCGIYADKTTRDGNRYLNK